MDFLGEIGPFRLLFADRQEADARVLDPDDLLAEEVSHDGELKEVKRLAGDVRAHVQQHGPARQRRENGCQRGPVDPVLKPDDHLGDGHDRAGVPGRDEPARGPVAHQLRGDADRRVALLAQRDPGSLVHGHDLRGVPDLDPEAGAVLRLDQGQELGLPSHQDDAYVVGPDRFHRALDFGDGRVFAPHRIDSNLDHRVAAS